MTDSAGGAGGAAAGTRSGAVPHLGSVRAPEWLPRRAAFTDQIRSWQALIERALTERLPAAESEPTRLHAAMRYSVLNGGRRVRPLLLFCAARAVGLGEAQVEGAACAIELIHAYARVHDDLPALDDEDVRRGEPTCHLAYDEGTAVLVGDALQSLAFQLLASDEALPRAPRIRLRLIELLAEAIGASGNAGGQSIEAGAKGQRMPVAGIEAMYVRKTGALIRAGVLMAAGCAPETPPPLQEALGSFATSVGLAFQIQNDLLDLSGGAATAGTARRAERARHKVSYPGALGAAAAQQRVQRLYAEALAALQPFAASADTLRALTEWLLVRDRE